MRALAIVLLAACGHGDDPPPSDACAGCDFEQRAVVRWVFYPHVGQDAGPCPAEVANIEVLVDSGEARQFPCAAPFGEMAIESRAQRVFARTLDAAGNVLAATAPRFLPSDFRVTVAFYGDAGFVRVFIPRPGASCMSTVPVYMSLRLAGAPAGSSISKTFYCTEDQDARDGVLLSDPLPAGTYDLHLVENGIERARNGLVVGTNNAVTDVDFTTP